ncbi:replication restart DNA helicase PriA [Trichocoleus sp. FACHB-69]|uniref:replication restart DNA helicase PriA n=2 Tax=Cyanophyceae TaxID=3028117 RepID=UPI001F5599F3|nr:replication restart DNA helicase PriA [Trichocoleus sp. FACHB-69]
MKTLKMEIVQAIRCPNCGSPAERYYINSSNLTRTQCHSCDYLMVTCSLTGKVIEAYAPGLYAHK